MNDEQIKEEFRELKEILQNIEKKLFRGNGQPPLTIQIDRLNSFKNTACWFIGICSVSCVGLMARLVYVAIKGHL